MGYRVATPERLEYEERGDRSAADLTAALALRRSRARLWRYPPRTRGRRHKNFEQEEVFVVVAGTLTALLDDPPERVDVRAPGVVAVETDTPLQLFNDSDEELVLFIYGAPPATEQSEMLEDAPLSIS